ncbi:hypothetical protein [Streptomyces sp. CBMA152]|uniref:hypothetical protein n=1 Tax=Streptomyces sp. CBMA152 TaxID=1896312 RepID=UPI001CB74CD5|nr:hypothetical protein [Streptomyces sp. CBMA152]
MSEFATLLSPSPGNAKALTGWIARARDTDLLSCTLSPPASNATGPPSTPN